MKLHLRRRLFRYLAILASWSQVGLPTSASAAQLGECSPSWISTFGGLPGTDERINAEAVFDDGGGPALYAAGSFAVAGGVPARRIAKWNGSVWSALGLGLSADVYSLAVFDDGEGPALYAAGYFTTAGGAQANHVAKWDGSSWSALGSGLNATVYTLAVYDDGGGPALYAGGFFTTAGGAPASHVARWDGTSWSALGAGTGGFFPDVLALSVFDDGSGPALYAAGYFTIAGGLPANRIAKWDGSSWSALGDGINDSVYVLAVHDDGGGPALYAGGSFTSAGGIAARNIARWNGSSWSALGSGTNRAVEALAVYDGGSGPELCVGGEFTSAGGMTTNYVARWNGTSWSALGSGMNTANDGFVFALTVYDDGGGPQLYAGGDLTTAGGVAAKHVARWNGSSWSALGSGLTNPVLSMATFDDGGAPALVVAGSSPLPAERIGSRCGADPPGCRWAAG